MLLPAILVANIGVPLLLLLWPAHWLALVPLTMLQAELAHRRLELPRRRALQIAGLAKLASTALGVPLAWLGMLALQWALGAALWAIAPRPAVVLDAVSWPLRAAWLEPTEDAWSVYGAFAWLCVPCGLMALRMEFAVARRMLTTRAPDAVRSWILRANLFGYALILLGAGTYPLMSGGRAW